MIRRAFVFAFLSSLCAACGAQAPLKREYARSILLVQLRVGDAPGWALVDTGSPTTYVDVSLKDDVAGVGSQAKSAVAKLWIGGKMTVKQSVRFLDLQPFDNSAAKRPLIAILGRDLLGQYAVGIDTQRRMMRLWKGGKVPLETVRRWGDGKEKGGISVDVQVERPGRTGGEVLALDLVADQESGAWTLPCRLGSEGSSLALNVDTGSSFTSVHWEILSKLGLKPIRTETIADVFGATVRRVMALPALVVGSLVLTNVEVYADAEERHPNLLAPKDLGVAWYVIDPAAGKLYVPGEKYCPSSAPPPCRSRLTTSPSCNTG
jgi:hypothetical protein